MMKEEQQQLPGRVVVPNGGGGDHDTTTTTTRTTTTEGGGGCCCCCEILQFENVNMAKGYAMNNTSRGVIVMSNIFLSTSILYLANKEAGCIIREYNDNDDNDNDYEEIVDENCTGRVYGGQKPAALIANIAVVSGILSALLMPLFGALLDYTCHRWTCGVSTAIIIIIIQLVQAYTVQDTWFAMTILQAITGFLYQVEVLAVYSYLPEMARLVGENVMTKFQSTFTMIQFCSQCIFLIIIIVISMIFQLSDVHAAQISQLLSVIYILYAFTKSWSLFPIVPAAKTLSNEQHQSLLTTGFIQIIQTTKHITTTYKHSLRNFLLAVIFQEAAVNAFTVVSVTFLDEEIGLSGTEIGIFFLVTLIATLPGSMLGAYITSISNPKISLIGSLLCLMIVTIVGAIFLTDDNMSIAYIWAICIGILLGWFYPTEGLFFSLCLPKGNNQDSELTGFYVYCTQIIVWLPPLVFSGFVNAGIDQKYGIISITIFMFIAIIILSMLPSWNEILQDVHKDIHIDTTTTQQQHQQQLNDKIHDNDDDDDNNNNNNNENDEIAEVCM